jgi:2-dehydro-3-deoxyphosphogluconate aldolase/(4S)-4-hydroxy-2-oxoglutarate aldolase
MTVDEICALAPVIPVLTVPDAAAAAPLARALVAGGLRAIEVTLRTPAALDAIRAMRAACPDAAVGAGTLRAPDDVAAARAAGAVFGASPGATPRLLDAVERAGLPFLPGFSTAAEAMALAERGFRTLKFFPAEYAGGPRFLGALAAPLPELRFCPTGGIAPATAEAWLRTRGVVCVGGSWLAPPDAVAAGDWARIEALARAAAALRPAGGARP